jgi:hypothetical protein
VKVGTDNSKKTMLAVGLFVIALFLFIRMFTAAGSPSTAAAPAANTTSTAMPTAPGGHTMARRGRPASKTTTTGPVTPNLDPRLHLNYLQEAENTDYTGNGRNIFLAQANDVVIPQPIAQGLKPKPGLTPTPGPIVQTPPPPPPIDLKFFGFASTQGVKRVFLARGDDVFVASEGDIVNRRYKVVKINPNNIEVLDVLNNNRQTIPLTSS